MSARLRPVDGRQGGLPLAQRKEDPPLEVIARIPRRLDAIRRAIEWAEMDDCTVGQALGVDKPQWSRILNGQAHFPTERYHQFHQVVGNLLLLRWDALQEGCEIRSLESELERENRELHEQLDRQQAEIDAIKRFLRETR